MLRSRSPANLAAAFESVMSPTAKEDDSDPQSVTSPVVKEEEESDAETGTSPPGVAPSTPSSGARTTKRKAAASSTARKKRSDREAQYHVVETLNDDHWFEEKGLAVAIRGALHQHHLTADELRSVEAYGFRLQEVTFTEGGTPGPGSKVMFPVSGKLVTGLVVADSTLCTHVYVKSGASIQPCILVRPVGEAFPANAVFAVPYQYCHVTSAVHFPRTRIHENIRRVPENNNDKLTDFQSLEGGTTFYDSWDEWDVPIGTTIHFCSVASRGGSTHARWDAGVVVHEFESTGTVVVASAGWRLRVPVTAIARKA